MVRHSSVCIYLVTGATVDMVATAATAEAPAARKTIATRRRGAARIRRSAIGTEGEAAMLNTKLVTWALGIWAGITFVLCVVYGLITPQNLGMQGLLEQMLPAFRWLTWWGFLLGLVESFLYGAYAGLVFCPIYNWLSRRWGQATGPAR